MQKKAQLLWKIEKKDGYEISGSTVKLDVGGLYEFTAKELQNIQVLDIQGDFGGGSDTFIIVKDGGSVKLPKTMNNGKELGSIEAGMTGSVVFLVPNAQTVTGNAFSGHVVAPSADVELGGGYFNGCVIAKNFHAKAECHMWNYNGKILKPTPEPTATPTPEPTATPSPEPTETPEEASILVTKELRLNDELICANSAPVKTGDNTPISFFVLLIAMTTVIMAYSGRKLRRRQKRGYIYKKSIACKK